MTGRPHEQDAANHARAPIDGSPFFLVDELPAAGAVTLGGPEGRHAAQVRRMRAGEQLVLSDGRGGWARATVRGVDRGQLHLELTSASRQAAPVVRVILVQAVPKGEHGERAVDLATEAGVDEIVPWSASRCVARWSGDRAEKGVARWQAVAREAAKQARRPYVPVVRRPADTAEVARMIGRAAGAVVLQESESTPLAAVPLPAAGDLVLVVGPEGGIATDELAAFRAAGATAARLGPEVLRSSAAAAVALGALGVLTDRWTDPESRRFTT